MAAAMTAARNQQENTMVAKLVQQCRPGKGLGWAALTSVFPIRRAKTARLFTRFARALTDFSAEESSQLRERM